MNTTTTQYQPKTGRPCGCRAGRERDNCPQCEGTGQMIDFAAIRARTRIPTKAEYEARERAELMKALREVRFQPLVDSLEACAGWASALVDNADHQGEARNLVAERVGWLLNGSYGKGAYDAAWQIVGETRRNRVAALGRLVAALEWRCPEGFAREAWRKLTPAQQTAVDAAIQEEIDCAVKKRGAR